MEVRQYHISGHIFWGYSLTQALYRPYIWQVPPIQVPEMAIENSWCSGNTHFAIEILNILVIYSETRLTHFAIYMVYSFRYRHFKSQAGDLQRNQHISRPSPAPASDSTRVITIHCSGCSALFQRRRGRDAISELYDTTSGTTRHAWDGMGWPC